MDFITQCEEIAKQNFSIPSLRPAQKDVLALIEKEHFVLATLPTGAGKTLLYAIPALILKEGPVLVISPLISLMRDQARRMNNARISCVIFTSDQNDDERKQSWQLLQSGKARIVFASPERFVLPSFINALIKVSPSMVVIDEAHCVVAWGHHFRPEYAEIGRMLSYLSPKKILAITATAAKQSRLDIIQKVFPNEAKVSEFVSKPISENIFVQSIRLFSLEEQWLKLLDIIKKTDSQKTIIYFQTRVSCTDFAKKLKILKMNAVLYHAGLSKQERRDVEQYIHTSEKKVIICATTAFGMGVDITGIRLVVIYGFPGNIEEFFQMLGRAGRGGEASKGVLLWTGSDPIRRDYQFKALFPAPTIFIEKCAKILSYLPKQFSESLLIRKSELLPSLAEYKSPEKELESLCGGLRICQLLEDLHSGEVYIQIKLASGIHFSQLLHALPNGMTKRRKILEGFLSLCEKEWLVAVGAQHVFLLKSVLEICDLSKATLLQVMDHYKEQGSLYYSLTTIEKNQDWIILKHGYMYLQKSLLKYVSVRNHFQESLHELDKLTKASGCRLKSSFNFFASRSIQGASKQNKMTACCNQCDLCLNTNTFITR